MEITDSQYEEILSNIDSIKRDFNDKFRSLEEKLLKSMDDHLNKFRITIEEQDKMICTLDKRVTNLDKRLFLQESKSIVLEHDLNVLKKNKFPWYNYIIIGLLIINIALTFLVR